MFGWYSTFEQILVVAYMTMTMKMIFLDAWDNMLDKYDLKNNNWLQRQFELRENWVLVYGRKTLGIGLWEENILY